MRCEVDKFEINCIKHPFEASAEVATWRVLIHIKFKSDDPANWGELRAYGGSWTRTLNRSHAPRDLDDGPPEADPSLQSKPRKSELLTQLVTRGSYPVWGDILGPAKNADKEWHLDNDQHIEIFYAKQVKGVPRSMPNSNHVLADDDNKPDQVSKALRREEIDLDNWHIVGRDEPSISPFQIGDFVEYWHHAEFQIRVPHTTKIVATRRLHCRVTGLYPNYKYIKSFR